LLQYHHLKSPLIAITSVGEIPHFHLGAPGPPGPQGGAPHAGSGRRADLWRRRAAAGAAAAAAGADAEGGGVSARREAPPFWVFIIGYNLW